MRQQTKALCYGIIYGMGAKCLSDQLQITETDAVVFMDTFRNTYPGIKSFIADTVKSCRDKEYVETFQGRRRYLPTINENDLSKKGLYFTLSYIRVIIRITLLIRKILR